jgi:hypothetical protein
MLAFTLESQRVVCELHVDVPFAIPRQLSHEDEGIVGLVEVDRWRPAARSLGARLGLGAADTRTEPVVQVRTDGP